MTSPRASEEPDAEEPSGSGAHDSSAAMPDSTPDGASRTPAAGTPATSAAGPTEPTPTSGEPVEDREQAEPAEAPQPEHPTPQPTGIRWASTGETPPTGTAARTRPGPGGPGAPGDDDPTPPSGVPAGQTTPGTWPHPGFPDAAPPAWQQTAPGWAPPAPRRRDPARRRRVRRIVLAIVLGLVVVAAVVVALLAFLVGPRFARYDVLDRAAVERGVTDVLTRDWHRTVTGVTCPDAPRVIPGTSFTCTATVDGRPQQVPVDVTDENGTYEVGQPR